MYAALIPSLQAVARQNGYALAVHGSMARDLDVIAVPWTHDAVEPTRLAETIRQSFQGVLCERFEENPAVRPHGRLAYAFYFNEKDASTTHGPYLDLSIMPIKYDDEVARIIAATDFLPTDIS